MNRRSFLVGIRNFAIGLAISPSLEHFVPEILPAETRVPPRLDESLTLTNIIKTRKYFQRLIDDFWFDDSYYRIFFKNSKTNEKLLADGDGKVVLNV